MRLTATLRDAQTAHKAWVELWTQIKPLLIAGHRLIVEVVDSKSREQERLYHSCFADLARDCELGGFKVDAEAWKRALLHAFYMATKDDPDHRDDWRSRAPRMIPTLDGSSLLLLGIESKGFTKSMASAFIEFVHATGSERGVTWSRTSIGRDEEL